MLCGDPTSTPTQTDISGVGKVVYQTLKSLLIILDFCVLHTELAELIFPHWGRSDHKIHQVITAVECKNIVNVANSSSKS